MQQADGLGRRSGMEVTSPGRSCGPDPVEELVREQREALTRYAYVLTGDAVEAEDVLQVVLVRLAARDLGAVDNLAAFATRAVTNEFLSRKRALKRLVALEGRLRSERPVAAVDPLDELAERDLLRWALQPLSRRQRAAVTLRYLHDLDDTEIAEHLGCAVGTVRSLVSRVLPVVRARLTDWEDA